MARRDTPEHAMKELVQSFQICPHTLPSAHPPSDIAAARRTDVPPDLASAGHRRA